MAIRYYYSGDTGQEVVVSGGAPLSYPWHMHMRHWTFGLVRRGVAELRSSAGTRRMDAGGFFIVPPRMPHSLRIAGRSELLALCLDEAYALQHAHKGFPHVRQFLLSREHELFAQMIARPIRQACAARKRQAVDVVSGLAQRLVACPEEKLSLAAMARIASISPWHFLRRFRLETGMTPHAFLLNCKIRHLRSLLRGRVAAADAAALTGFADQSHMHKLFKSHHNLTPRQFVLASSRLDNAAG